MKVSSSVILLVFVSVILTKANAHRSSDHSSSHPPCPAKKYWNEKRKACVCRPEHKCFPAGGHFDKETCTYVECKEKTCDDNKNFDRKICDCECRNHRLKNSCTSGKSWNNQTCSCECNNATVTCPYPQVRNNETCECTCPDLSLQNSCAPGKFWNNQTCRCECNYVPINADCPGKQVWSNATCGCDCSDLTLQGLCTSHSGPNLWIWDKEVCDCYCVNCKPGKKDI